MTEQLYRGLSAGVAQVIDWPRAWRSVLWPVERLTLCRVEVAVTLE